MGFDICFKWREKAADAVARNDELARSLLAKFPSLSRFPLDFDAIAKSVGVPRDEVLSHWCQIELDDEGDQLGRAIIIFWPESVVVQVPSRPRAGIPATLERLAPLFGALREVGLETDPEFDVLAEYEMQSSARADNPPLERTAPAVYFTGGRASRVRRRGRSTALRSATEGASDGGGDGKLCSRVHRLFGRLSLQ